MPYNNNNPYERGQFPYSGNNMANPQQYFQPGQDDDLADLGGSMTWMEPKWRFDPGPQ